ncbi:gliding motility-associated C-terminal domain-containing protein [Saccharicrinis carchari]|uniref:Gliding motility-associated C-terminal domain-containing protein n=1 Tax=Saccharicrinis carchari TaxID=1168039 RepID=A0A521BX89_SACCC|nr:T9SS type B sorting domain-containing protein [Saccharicrinis carchari]SMO51786.1 gliding motility-associated C-terminal domain-containing protein [Saccharicrinis carchari]
MKFPHQFALVFLCLLGVSLKAQTGTDFWFVAPDAIHAHGDEPLYFRITTFDKAASVTISMPADNGFKKIKKNIGKNELATIEVPRSSVENRPVDRVNNKGIRIESSANITVYYEIADDGNPDKFTLKGDNAMGTEFYVPSQNVYPNMAKYKGDANEKADIVATADNTVVTIVPTVDVTGHKKDIPFQITLNRGQSYCIEYRNISPSASMAGTYITSNKPIAVTISDDSINETDHPHDIIGDQLIPTSIIGSEYIAVKTNRDKNGAQKVFVLATEDDTYVFINNDNNLVRHLKRGELTGFDITDNAIYISATKPVYAYQVSGLANIKSKDNANELGSALLPCIECTGSSKVAFTRVFVRDFWVQILTQQKNVDSFVMYDNNKGSVDYVDNLQWVKVKGTDTGDPAETWFTAIANMNISTGTPYTIENTKGLFHLSILDENDPRTSVGSVSYGYFSSYGRMHIEGPSQECQGKEVVLSTSIDMNDYRWYSKSTGNTVLSTDKECRITRSDTYWVTAQMLHGGCVITDSLDVTFVMPDISLGNDTVVCPGEVVNYDLPAGYPSYVWSNAATGNSTSVTAGSGFSENLSVVVTDGYGCEAEDTVRVEAFATPVIRINKTVVCEGERVVNTTAFMRYQWEFKGKVINSDDSKNFIIPSESGTYTLTVWSANGCMQTRDIDITVNPLPNFTLADEWSCYNSAKRINGPVGDGYSYRWSSGEIAPYIDLASPADYALEITDANGCVAHDEARFDWYDPQVIDLGDDREECSGITLHIDGLTSHTDFVWKYKKTAVDDEVLLPIPMPENVYQIANAVEESSGIYKVEAIDENGCPVSDSIKVKFYRADPPVLKLERDLCDGEQIQIHASSGYDSYTWYRDGINLSIPSSQNSIEVSAHGKYQVEATYLGCVKRNDIDVTSYALPTVSITDDLTICKGDVALIRMDSFTSPDGSNFDYLIWNIDKKKYYDETSVLQITEEGIYSVTAFDEHGCSASDQVEVGVFSPTLIADEPPVEACENISVTLSNPVPNAQSYAWHKVESTGNVPGPSNAPWTVNQSGTYGIQLVDVNGCSSYAERVIKLLPVPSLDLGPDIGLCSGESAILKAPDVYAQYQWNGDPLLNSPGIRINNTGVYTLVVKNTEGCEAQDQVSVHLNPSPAFEVTDQEVCPGTNVILTAPANVSDFLWSTGETTRSISATKGTYWVSVKNSYGCTGADTASVKWHPVPKVNLGADTLICPVDYLYLDAGEGFASYLWHSGAATQKIKAQMQDTINLVQVQNEHGCYGFDTKTVRYMIRPDIVLCSDTSVCKKDTFDIDAGAGYISYLWNDGSSEQTMRIAEPGEYWVEVSDGCMIMRDTANVVYQENPIITRVDTSIYSRVAVWVEGGTKPYRYSINNNAYGSDNVFENLKAGDHTIEIEDFYGCKALATISLNNYFDVVVPPFFTPNNDGINDRWEIEGIDRYPDCIIKIFDRYGKLLKKYPASDPGWDGRYLGQPVPTDDYWYVIEVPGNTKVLKGHITLKR